MKNADETMTEIPLGLKKKLLDLFGEYGLSKDEDGYWANGVWLGSSIRESIIHADIMIMEKVEAESG